MLNVDEGEVFGFLGPNAAGKTTPVRMLCCLISKTSGRAWIGGYEVGKREDSLKIRKMIGLLPENVGLSYIPHGVSIVILRASLIKALQQACLCGRF